ncbi:MAG: glycosyltransferase family 39 protein [Candidatus Aureabacteria bacterium]|nr:glycosyltransferase family 39 protein [Candidatus Auribacterota bacterium]
MQIKKGSRYKPAILGIIFIAGAVYRFFAVFPPVLTYDELSYALQAFQIYKGNDLPIFLYGWNFQGAGGAYILALLYKCMGVTDFTLNFYGWTTSVIFYFLIIMTAKRFFGINTAIMTALLVMIPTPDIMYWAHESRPEYTLTFISVSLILLMTHVVVDRFRNRRLVGYHVFLLGLVSGFGAWNNLITVLLAVVSFFVIFYHFRRVFLKKHMWFFLLGGFIGFFPEILANIKKGFFIFRMGTSEGFSSLSVKVKGFVTFAYPYFWGILDLSKKGSWLRAGIIAVLLWVTFLYVLFYLQWRERSKQGKDVLSYQIAGTYILFHLFIAFISIYGRRFNAHIRYLTPLYSVAFLIPAAAIENSSWKNRKYFLFLPLLFLMLWNFQETRAHVKDFFRYVRNKKALLVKRFPDRRNPYMMFCFKNNLYSGYLDCGRDNFLNMSCIGESVFSNFYQEKYLPHALRVDASKDIFWLWGDSQRAVEHFRMIGCSFEEEIIDRIHVYYNFEKEEPALELLKDYDVIASKNQINAGYMHDGVIDSFWRIYPYMTKKKESVIFRFNKPECIYKMVMIPSSNKEYFGNFSLFISEDGNDWEELRGIESKALPVFWSVYHPFIKVVKLRAEFFIPTEKKISFLKLEYDKEDPNKIITINEVYLYRKKEVSENVKDDVDKDLQNLLMEVEKQDPGYAIIADHWFSDHFCRKGFQVEFISNKYTDSYQEMNPHLIKYIPVDFSRKWIIIASESHMKSILEKLDKYRIGYKVQEYGKYSIIKTERSEGHHPLYWNGLELNEMHCDSLKVQQEDYPSLKNLFGGFKEISSVFGDKFHVTGCQILQDKSGESLCLYIELVPIDEIKKEYYLFAHFSDSKEHILFQGDMLMHNCYGTTVKWAKGKRVVLERRVPVPADTSGKVSLSIGIWDPAQEKRLRLPKGESRCEIAELNFIKSRLVDWK